MDDLAIIVASFTEAEFGRLGSAGWCYARGGSLLPFMGRMRFDTADIARLEEVILPPIGFVNEVTDE